MKKSTIMYALFVAGIIAATSCSKKETETVTPASVPAATTMGSLTGTWKSTGADVGTSESTYSQMTLTVKADSTCTWTKIHKSSATGNLTMEGKVLLERSGAKDNAGKPIDRIWFTFTKINGQNFGGSTHGIYQVSGTALIVDWEFMKSGAVYPDASKGFGSGESGQESISKYTKQ